MTALRVLGWLAFEAVRVAALTAWAAFVLCLVVVFGGWAFDYLTGGL